MSNKQQPQRLDVINEQGSLSGFTGFKKFWPFLKPYLFLTILGILLTIPVGALDAAVASFLKPFMDNVMVDKDTEFAYKVPFIIIGFTIVQGICIYTSIFVISYVGSRIATNEELVIARSAMSFVKA